MAGLKDVYARWKAKRAEKRGDPLGGDEVEPLPYDEGSAQDELAHEDLDGRPGAEEGAEPLAAKDADELKGSTKSVRKIPATVLVVVVAILGGAAFLAIQLRAKTAAPPPAQRTPEVAAAKKAVTAVEAAPAPVTDTDTGWLTRAKETAAPAPDERRSPKIPLGVPGFEGEKDEFGLPKPDLTGRGSVPGPRVSKGPEAGGMPGSNGSSGATSSGDGTVVWTMKDVRERNFEKDPAYAEERMAQARAGLAMPAVAFRRDPRTAPAPGQAPQAPASQRPAQEPGKAVTANASGIITRETMVAAISNAPGQYLPSLAAAPVTKYIVKAGTAIPVALRNTINTDLPGPVYAMVTRNVYDSPTGRFLLIPQGTSVSGRYQATVAYGQERVYIAWTRMDFPDGTYFDLQGQPSLDFAGMAGIKDQVDNHYLKTFSSALMMSIVGAVSSSVVDKASQRENSGGSPPTVAGQASLNLANYFGTVAMEQISKGMGLQPTLIVRQGALMNVGVTADLVLPGEYQN